MWDRQLEELSVFQFECDDEDTVTLNIFPTKALCKLTNLRSIQLINQALMGTAAALSSLSQLHTLQL